MNLVMGLRCVFMPFLMDPRVCREPAHGALAAIALSMALSRGGTAQNDIFYYDPHVNP
jgi:hypothetical protein